MTETKKKFRLKKKFRKALHVIYAVSALIALFVTIKMLITKKDKAYGIEIPKGYEVHGIDVSRYQGDINWDELVRQRSGKESIKIDFVFIKATEGRSLTDPKFKTNWEKAKNTNTIRGAYHYFIPNRSAKEQADNFIKTVKLEKGDLPPVLDIEVRGKHGSKKLVENIKIWLNAIEKHYGIKPILYTYADFYQNNLEGSDFEEYTLWVAHYNVDKPDINKKWHFWQHNDKGKIKTIKEHIDFNVFNGSIDDLKSLCKK